MTKRPNLRDGMKSVDDRVSPEIKAVTERTAEGSNRKPSRVGKKGVVVNLDADTHKRLKYLSFELGSKPNQLLELMWGS